VVSLATSAPALASPVTIDFESGASVGDQITNQYASPGAIPEGPTFMPAASAGFTAFGCSPGHLTTTAAHSPTHSVALDGCASGSEFSPTTTFFSMGYTTDSVSFWIAIGGGIISGAHDTVITTAFDANRNELQQVVTTLGPQSGPTWQQVTLTATGFNIAFVAVELGNQGGNSSSPTGVGDTVVDLSSTPLYLDDLTYDPPASPPNSSFVLGASPAATSTVDGGQVQINIPVTWVNNPNPSANPVTLAATTPTGVTASFSPNPTNTGTSLLTLDVSKTAPVGQTSVTVTGTVGAKTAQVIIPFGISAPFEVGNPGAVTLAPCTPKQVQLSVSSASTVTQPISLFVTTSNQPGVTITGISGPGGPGTVTDPSHANVTVTPQNGSATATLSLSVAPGTAPASARIFAVQATSTGYADQSNLTGSLAIEAGQVDKVTNAGLLINTVRAPWLGQASTPVTLTGAGFCPGTRVAIGDPDNPVDATSISGDGTSLTFSTPRGGTTGPIELLPPTGQSFSGPRLTVRTFRNTWGFPFANADFHTLLSQDMEDQLFGQSETNINVFGWLIRKPEAYEYQTITNNHVAGGLCFGFAYSSLEFFDNPAAMAGFPLSGGNDPWHLDTSNPTDTQNIVNFVVERFSLQFTDQLIPYEVNAVLGVHGTDDDLNAIKQGLAGGEPVMIGMVHWEGASIAGHTVLAYDTQQLPDGSTAVDVVNSNEPYQTSEESNPAAHDASEFTNSQIIIKNGNWTFPEGADFQGSNGQPWSGSEADLVVYPHSALPIINGAQPKLPNVFTGAIMVAFGSAADGVTQLTGSGGGTLFTHGQLAPQTGWPKGAAPVPDFTAHPGPLQLVALQPSLARTVTATVERHAGGGAMDMRLPGLDASLQAGVHNGQVDTLALNPRADSFGYATSAARASLSGTLLSSGSSAGSASAAAASAAAASAAGAGASLSDRIVKFGTSLARSGADTIAFPAGGQLTVHHTGPASSLTLTLSSFGAGGQPVAVTLPAVRLASGETLQVAPTSWRALGTARIRVRARVRGRTKTTFVKGRIVAPRFAAVRSATLHALGHGRYRLDLGLHLGRAPAGAWLSVAASIRRGHRTLATTAPVQLIGSTLRTSATHLTLAGTLTPGHYTLVVRLLEASGTGPVKGSVIVTHTIHVVA
jgi:hypothetical protein